jgi:hypothetical protein
MHSDEIGIFNSIIGDLQPKDIVTDIHFHRLGTLEGYTG